MVDNDKIYAGDDAFWDKYVQGRPIIPDSFFRRICEYHAEHGGRFDVAHDIGAGVGVQSPRLAKYFQHVIVSDIVAANVELAEGRLGKEMYSYRAAKIEDASDLEEDSVDLVMASFAMHFAHYDEAMPAIAKQLRPGGTFAALIGAVAILDDARVNEIWHRMWDEGQRVLLRHAKDRKDRLRTLGNVSCGYDSMPLDEALFHPGAQRVSLNAGGGTWPSILPADLRREYEEVFGDGNRVGKNDRILYTDEAGWNFTADVTYLREQFETLPFAALEPSAFSADWEEIEQLMTGGRTVEGRWPARIVLATKK